LTGKIIPLAAGLALLAALWAGLVSGPVGGAQAAPAAQLTLVPTPTPRLDGRIIYIAQAPATAWRIAAVFNISLDQLRALNNWDENPIIHEGDEVLLGIAGPAQTAPTAGPTATPQPSGPTPTVKIGNGVLCVILYDDLNGDSMRQEEELPLPGGAINVSGRSVSLTANSDDIAGETCNDANIFITGFVAFADLPEGKYTISAAIPDGYNPTTQLSREAQVAAGDTSYLAFGAQANTETAIEIQQVIPTEEEQRSPLIGIGGGLLLLGGVGLGVYAFLLRRSRS